MMMLRNKKGPFVSVAPSHLSQSLRWTSVSRQGVIAIFPDYIYMYTLRT